MPNYKVAGHDVEFPHNAYGVQLLFMDRLLQCLDSRNNALLEAPTGCGKTLALLCGALAWQAKHKKVFDDQAEQDALREQIEGTLQRC
jgi:Rad3-related DNA helicase